MNAIEQKFQTKQKMMDLYFNEKLIAFVKNLIDICEKPKVEEQAKRMSFDDRCLLYDQLGLDVLEENELEQHLLTQHIYRESFLDFSDNKRNALENAIINADCSVQNTLNNVINKLYLYGTIQDNSKETYQKNKKILSCRKNLIDKISNSNNEKLKVVLWAVFSSLVEK